MTEYDKENHWYGHNGGECPVHPETEVEVVFASGRPQISAARNWEWVHYGIPSEDIIAFRITRLYREPKVPREFWVVFDGGSTIVDRAYCSRDAAVIAARHIDEIVHVREVLEGEA